MKPSAKTALAVFLLAIPVATFASPNTPNPQRHNQVGRSATMQTPSTPAKKSMECAGCTTVVVERRVAGQRTTVRTEKTECSGCETMTAGKQCY